MDDRAPTDQASGTCTLMVTVPGQFEEWVSRTVAYKWAAKIVRKALNDASASWEGELKKVVPLRATIAGTLTKLQFEGVPERLMISVVILGFEAHR